MCVRTEGSGHLRHCVALNTQWAHPEFTGPQRLLQLENLGLERIDRLLRACLPSGVRAALVSSWLTMMDSRAPLSLTTSSTSLCWTGCQRVQTTQWCCLLPPAPQHSTLHRHAVTTRLYG